MTTPYATSGARLVEMGYSAIPIMPGAKRPGRYELDRTDGQRKWFGMLDWSKYCDRLPTEFETPLWSKWPEAGVCIALDHQVKVVDIDTDDEEIRAALAAVLPDSPVKKRGAKGFSVFYRGSAAILPRSFNIGSDRVVDLLAYGKQTVLPPTIHPDIGRPYVWLDDPLDLYAPDDLPELPDDIAEQIAAVLEQFGYRAPVERDPVTGDFNSSWREVNDIAMSRMDDWVPNLGLARMQRNRTGGYRSVASFRPSGSGKPMSKRNLHMAFHPDGIKDWGDNDRSYTPIDIVAVSLPCSDLEAFNWLREKLDLVPKPMDVSRLIANGLAKSAQPLVLPEPAPEQEQPAEPRQNAPVRAPQGTVDPFAPVAAGGVMGAVAGWILGSAWRPVPELAMAGAVSFCAALFGRRYATPTGLGLNLYLIGVAGSGFGKDHPLKCVQALLADAGMQYLTGPGDITSDSALEHIVRQRPCFVMPMDEIGVFLQATGGRNSGGYERRIRKVFLDLYTKGDGMWTGKQKVPMQGSKAVVDNAAEPVYMPTISILGMSTPTEFYAGITEANLSDGMVGRMTIVAPQKRPEPREDRIPVVPPPSLVAEVKRAAGLYPAATGNLSANNWRSPTARPMIYHVPWSDDETKRRWRQIEEWQLSAIDEDPGKDGIVGRAAEQSLKLATLRACSRAPENPAVRMDDIEWAWSIVSASLWAIESGVDKYMVSSDFERLTKDILRYAAEAGGKIAMSILLKKRGMSKEPRLLKAALEHLAAAGQIYPVPAGARQVVQLRSEDEQEAA